MKATVEITNGKETRLVTEHLARQTKILSESGFWIKERVKSIPQAAKTIPQEIAVETDVDLLSDTVVEEETKAEIVSKLKEAGIKFNPNDKKEVLKSLLTEGK